MKPGEEDEAWRLIVENYGEPPVIDDVEVEPFDATSLEDVHVEVIRFDDPPDPPENVVRAWDDEGRFVPPPVEPIPLAEPPRLAAWIGVFGVPLLFLLTHFVGGPFPRWLNMLLLAWVVGGFGYLVWTMPRTRTDPWDDGSRI